ncbi:unnamed protein product [Brassica napus]|uniref:(rape) hypothetical protein n=1 Tax=Brassica napus TaxID=3708 RepID=A0A816JHQ2_BRANA|nr:unnamed protein product [Brassica napus]
MIGNHPEFSCNQLTAMEALHSLSLSALVSLCTRQPSIISSMTLPIVRPSCSIKMMRTRFSTWSICYW